MPDISQILGAEHEVWAANQESWRREERRFYGRDAVLGDGTTEVELERFTNEKELSYKSRKAQATFLNFPLIHAKILAGHLARVAPMPNYGTLGDVRTRDEIGAGDETVAEAFHYNCDGVGKDGTQFRAWTTGVQERAISTGHRWVMVEMPRRPDVTRPVRGTDIRAGFRPFLVEYPPPLVPMWETTDGRTDWMVLRPRIRKRGQLWEPNNLQDGYYLLVRQGYAGLGDEFAGGGWWLYHADKTPVEDGHGTWAATGGQIPVTALIAESSHGTIERPAISGSLTMELGQIAVSLMNRISERNWDARDAAKSIKYVLGADNRKGPDGFGPWDILIEHHEENSILIPVIGALNAEGKVQIPSIYDSSAGAVAAEVYSTIIQSTITEAHEIMVRQLTSVPDASGVSKQVGFGEATSPLLATLAAHRESFENTLIYFAELRAGAASPAGFVVWPTEFELAPAVTKIDETIDRLLKIGARSPTLEAHLLKSAAQENGVWPDDDDVAVTDELTRSLNALRPEQTASVQQLTASGGTLEGALGSVGAPDDQITPLVGGGPNGSIDQTNPDAAVVTAGQDGEGAPGDIGNTTPQQQPDAGGVQPFQPRIADSGNREPDPQSNGRTRPNVNSDGRPDGNGAPPPGPNVDLTPVTDRLDALTQQIAALVSALANKPPAPPAQQAPMVIAIPQPVPLGKRITMQTESGAPITIDVQSVPPAENGANPNA